MWERPQGFAEGCGCGTVVQTFRTAMERVLGRIPEARVATCGSVARALGDVRAAKAVAAWILEHPEVEGARRVVRADGRRILSMVGERGAAKLARPEDFVEGLPRVGLLEELRGRQTDLASRVIDEDDFPPIRSLGAVDVAYEGERAHTAVVRCDAESLEPLEIALSTVDVDFPYIPTYLAFRELPAVEPALRRLAVRPEILLVDGHGQLHPALFGYACLVGVHLNIPTIGVAKHALVGKLRSRERVNGAVPIEHAGRVRGYAWVPPQAERPIFISTGHRVSVGTALAIVQRATRTRYPEPLRIADRLSKERKRGKKGEKES